MSMPSTSPARSLVRPGVFVVAGGLAVAGATLGWFIHPAWSILAVLGGLALILIPDPASSPPTEPYGDRPCRIE